MTPTENQMAQTERDDAQEIRRLSESWVAATKAGDVERLLALVTDDVIFLPPNAPEIRGKPAVEGVYRMFFAQFGSVEQTPSIDEIQVVGDWAFSWGTDALELTP